MRVGCCWRIGPEHQDMVFGDVRILVLLLVFHGNVPTYVFVAINDSGNNVMGKLQMTQNWLGSVICCSQVACRSGNTLPPAHA